MPEIRQWHASNVAPVWHLFSAKCGADLLCGALLARFVLIMGINAQRHIDRSVSCEILNLLDIQPAFKKQGAIQNHGSLPLPFKPFDFFLQTADYQRMNYGI